MKPYLLLVILAALGPLTFPTARAAEAYDERPVPIKTPPPVYPPELQHDGISGIVSVRVTIDETGNVTECTVSKSTDAGFEDAALKAVKKWKFRPATKEGTPVTAHIIIPIKFSANE